MAKNISENKKRRRRWPIAAAALVLTCAAILADSRWRLDTQEYTLSSPRLPAGFDGYRIVQLSDLHGMEFGADNRRLVAAVEKAAPDLIVLTGDFIESSTELEIIRALCTQLVELAPVYFVSGNHDAGSRKLEELAALLEESGVKYLRNEYCTLDYCGDQILLCGVEDPNTWAVMPKPDEVIAQLREAHPDDFVVLLGHRNDWP